MISQPIAPLVVVVVDEESHVAASTAELLNMCGFRAHYTTCGRDAVRLAAELSANAVVADLVIQEPDGFELARQLRAADRAPMLVALTSLDAEAHRSQSAAAGFDFHFVKPADPALLVGCLRRLACLLTGTP